VGGLRWSSLHVRVYAFVCVCVCVYACVQEYLPVEGLDQFLKLTSSVIFGKDSSVIKQGRCVSVCVSIYMSICLYDLVCLCVIVFAIFSVSFRERASSSAGVCVYVWVVGWVVR